MVQMTGLRSDLSPVGVGRDTSRVAQNHQLMDRQVFNKCLEFDQADSLVFGHLLSL